MSNTHTLNWSLADLMLDRRLTENNDHVRLTHKGVTVGTLTHNWTVDYQREWEISLHFVGTIGTVLVDKRNTDHDGILLRHANTYMLRWVQEQERLAYERETHLGTLKRDSRKVRTQSVKELVWRELDRLKQEEKDAGKTMRHLNKLFHEVKLSNNTEMAVSK